jgi:hypothetical protein
MLLGVRVANESASVPRAAAVNNIGDAGASAIADALCVNTTVAKVSLDCAGAARCANATCSSASMTVPRAAQ